LVRRDYITDYGAHLALPSCLVDGLGSTVLKVDVYFGFTTYIMHSHGDDDYDDDE